MPAASASCVLSNSRVTAAGTTPTGMVVAVSPIQPRSRMPMSSLTMSPYWMRRAPPMPWTTSSFTEMQMWPGKPRRPRNGLLPPRWAMKPRRELVDLARGNAGNDGERNFLKNFPRRAATDAHAFDIGGRLDGDAH